MTDQQNVTKFIAYFDTKVINTEDELIVISFIYNDTKIYSLVISHILSIIIS